MHFTLKRTRFKKKKFQLFLDLSPNRRLQWIQSVFKFNLDYEKLITYKRINLLNFALEQCRQQLTQTKLN